MTRTRPIEVLFTPCVTLDVVDGTVTGVSIDWSDTVRNAYQAGEPLWEDGDPSDKPVPVAVQVACDHIDEAIRARVAAALLHLPQAIDPDEPDVDPFNPKGD